MVKELILKNNLINFKNSSSLSILYNPLKKNTSLFLSKAYSIEAIPSIQISSYDFLFLSFNGLLICAVSDN